jgi:hypothetical protein
MRLAEALLLLSLVACGPEVPKGGVVKTADDAKTDAPKARRVESAPDLMPADLDLVLRVDLSKVRDSLGAEASEHLIGRAVDVAGAEGLIRSALARAEIVWVGLRMADVEAGDRVMAIRTMKTRSVGDSKPTPAVEPDSIAWKREDTEREDLARFVARGTTPRGGTERIFTFGEREAVFVSPVESQSVERLLREGADSERGQPVATGLLSLDYRTGKLSHEHENAYPSLAALVAGVIRMRATIDVVADRLELDGRIQCRSIATATKVELFLDTIRTATARRPRYAELLADLKLKRSESVVSIQWPMPRAVVAALLVDATPTPTTVPKTPAPNPPAPTTPPPTTPAPATPAPPAEPLPIEPTTPEPPTPPAPTPHLDRPVELPPRPGGDLSPDP